MRAKTGIGVQGDKVLAVDTREVRATDIRNEATEMRVSALIGLPVSVVAGLVESFSESNGQIAATRFGGNVPTGVLFAPEVSFPASLHYMFFPSGERQRFHWHPGGRHLIVIGDVDLTIRFNSCSTREDPYVDPGKQMIEANTLACIRFPSQTWHEFSAAGGGRGIVAFSFHDTDDVISTAKDLMEELTTFWNGETQTEKAGKKR